MSAETISREDALALRLVQLEQELAAERAARVQLEVRLRYGLKEGDSVDANTLQIVRAAAPAAEGQ